MPDSDLVLSATYRTAIDAKFAALPHPWRLLGRPTAAEVARAGGRVRTYLRGSIYWSGRTGAHEVHGPILARYLKHGGPASCLGFPSSDVVRTAVGLRSRFAGGVIRYFTAEGKTQLICTSG
jgi:uncharacterized protein with LGFP repeats